MEEQLWNACQRGDAEAAKKIIAENPDVNINWRNLLNNAFWTTSIIEVACACDNDHIVSLLLDHPSIDLNNGDKEDFHDCEFTPLNASCYHSSPYCTKVLLEDPRVVVSGLRGYIPLTWAIRRGNIKSIEIWIASGRQIDPLWKLENSGSNAIVMADELKQHEIATLLRQFVMNPEKVRYNMRLKWKYHDNIAAELFALVIFICDDLLKVKENRTSRFFSVTTQLPMELQMLFCLRTVGSATKDLIPAKKREAAFRKLTAILDHEESEVY